MKKKMAVDLMLDSGAFSAWNVDDVIDINDYMQFIHDNEDHIHTYVSLDVLASGAEKQRTAQAVEEAASASYKNLTIMQKEGLKPLPVFHQGERLYWLEKMLGEGIDYIGISTRKDLWPAAQMKWLDTVFSVITDNEGRPLVKTHGFGITRPPFLFRFPWHTVDSTTWTLTPGYGSVLVPSYVNGEFDYTTYPTRIIMSGWTHRTASADKMQFQGLRDFHQEVVRNYLENEIGINVTEARHSPIHRHKAVMKYYLKMMEKLKNIHFNKKFKRASLTSFKLDRKPPKEWKTTIVFVTNYNRELSQLMNELGMRNRLLNYYDLRDKSVEALHEYVETGTYLRENKRPRKHNWSDRTYRAFRALALLKRSEQDDAEV